MMKLAKGLLCSIFVAKLIDAKRFIVKTKGEKAGRFMASTLDDDQTLGKFKNHVKIIVKIAPIQIVVDSLMFVETELSTIPWFSATY